MFGSRSNRSECRRQTDLDQGYADYHVYAGSQIVGRIYQQARSPDQWRWAINSVMIDGTAGAGMAGYAESMEEAQRLLRPAFDRWLEWAQAIPAIRPQIRPAG
jgi:hypothetical protein